VGRKATSDDLELIFSTFKDTQSTASAVRSVSIKRAGTVAKTLRSPMSDGLSRAERERERSEQEGKTPAGEILGEILEVFIPAMIKEQSFIAGFLHLSPNQKSFEEFVAPGVDKSSWLRNLDKKRPPELDKNASKEIMNAMDQLLSWLPDELSSIIEWCRTLDALYDPTWECADIRQMVTVLGVLEKHIDEWEDSDQAFLVKTMNKQHDKLAGLFHRFVEEQVRAIEDMKVSAKKRQGVLLMFKIFPVFYFIFFVTNVRDLSKESKRSLSHLSSVIRWTYVRLLTKHMEKSVKQCLIPSKQLRRIPRLIQLQEAKMMTIKSNSILISV
jgi:exocyst complex component 1